MRIETIERKVYSWDEMTDEHKEKAIEKLFDINVDYEWWSYIYEDAAGIGLKITDFDIDRGSYCHGSLLSDCFDVATAIVANHGEGCDTHKTAKSYLERHAEIMTKYADEDCDNGLSYEGDKAIDELDEAFTREIFEDYRVILQNEYEYLTSRESIIDTITANEYEFYEDGNIA